MSKTLIVPAATPYAQALVVATSYLAKDVDADMRRIAEILDEVEVLKDYFVSPKVGVVEKKNFVRKLLKAHITLVSLNFLLLLIDRRRIDILSSIIEKYFELRAIEFCELKVEVTSAIPLYEGHRIALFDKLKRITNSKEVELKVRQDPNIIGGLLIQTGSQFIDLSVNGELRAMSNYLGSTFEF